MGIEGFLFALSVLSFLIQIVAWRWAVAIQRSLAGGLGHELARIIAWIMGWSIVARLAGLLAVMLFDRSHTDAAFIAAAVAQLFGVVIFIWAAWKIRGLQTPIDERTMDEMGSVEGDS